MRKVLMILSTTALLAGVAATPASAQIRNNRPIDRSVLLTFNAPVSLPDVTLPAGTYLFKFVDAINAPGVLWVMSKDGTTPYAMMHTIPIVRTETESNNSEIVTFKETPVNEPPAIDAWYFNAPDSAEGVEDVGCELLHGK